MADQPKAAPQRHVLVVDDNVELSQTYRELLQAFDYRVTTAANGVLALKYLQDNDADVILSDLSMPQLEGDKFFEAARRIRPELGQRFIFMTGHVDNPKYQPFLQRENVPVLYKPVSVANLLGALEAMFAKTAEK